MDFLTVIAIAVGLGMDAMSVCMAVGVRWHGRRQKFRLAWHMGLFQFLMPVLGWLAGDRLAHLLRSVGAYVAAGMVFAVGVKMLWEAVRSRPGAAAENSAGKDPTRGWSLMVLSVATSLDALVVGFSLGLRGHAIWLASVLIGLTAGAMALTGVILGKRIGAALGRPAEILGGLVLMGLGVAPLWL